MGAHAKQQAEAIVGVWEVEAPEAPFAWHMMTFTPFGTMLQSNPHEGNRGESDSIGQGVWQPSKLPGEQASVVGKFVEIKADRRTGAHIGKGVIEFKLAVSKDSFSGMVYAYRYDALGELVGGPYTTPVRGIRVVANVTIT